MLFHTFFSNFQYPFLLPDSHLMTFLSVQGENRSSLGRTATRPVTTRNNLPALKLIHLVFPFLPVDGLSVLFSKASPLGDPIPIYLYGFLPPAVLLPISTLPPPAPALLYMDIPADDKHLSKTFR